MQPPFSVVYIDDDNVLCDIFVELFSCKKFVIRGFADAEKAVASIGAEPPNLVIVDYNMNGITGDELALKLEPSIPKVLVSGEINLQTQYKFIKVFDKPFQIDDIQSFLDSFFAALSTN